MSNSISHTDSSSYAPLPRSVGKDDVQEVVVDVHEVQGRSQLQTKSNRKSALNLGVVVCISLIPLIVLAAWSGLHAYGQTRAGFFSSAPIGGKLSQAQAKAVDVVYSAILAPLLLAVLNYFWFTSARVAVVNEQNTRGVSLNTLLMASSSSSGSYDPLKFWHLVSSRAHRLALLGLLILSAAISSSALSNIIAYEAYLVDGLVQDVQLQYLRDDIADAQRPLPNSGNVGGLYQYNIEQRATFANQLTGMLTSLSIFNASSLLNGTDYYMVNATAASLNLLSSNITDVDNIPALKYSVDCQAETPSSVGVTASSFKATEITVVSSEPETRLFQALYPGTVDVLNSSYNDVYAFAGFNLAGNETYLGFGTSFNITNDTLTSPYDTIVPNATDMSIFGFSQTKSIMSWWGIRCWLTQQPGSATLSRPLNNTATTSWSVTNTTWDPSKSSTVKKLRLQELQTVLNYYAPDVTLPGFGAALANSAWESHFPTGEANTSSLLDWQTLALNFLYANSEANRLVYETAAMNTSRALTPDYFFQTTSTHTAQFYRMTYVPAIMFIAIASTTLAATISAGLTISSWRTHSGRNMRRVDSLRLLVDSVTGLKHEESFGRVGHRSNEEIEKWAADYKVRYEVLRRADGESVAVLRPLGT